MKKINLIEKFIDFSNQVNPDIFIEIFGKDKGNKLYHNIFIAICKKNMTKFISELTEMDKKLILI